MISDIIVDFYEDGLIVKLNCNFCQLWRNYLLNSFQDQRILFGLRFPHEVVFEIKHLLFF